MLIEETAIYLDGKYIRISEYTPAHQKKARYHHTWESIQEYGSRRLCLMIYSYDKWVVKFKEIDGKPLDKNVREIIQHLKDQVPNLQSVRERLTLEREQREKEWEEEKRLREIAREKAFLRDARKTSKEQIEEIIKNWDEAVQKHNFFKLAEEAIEKIEDPERTQLLSRVELARELIGTIDPVVYLSIWQTPGEILPLLKKRYDREYWEPVDDEDLEELEDD
jgi:hypothetical protein